MITCVNLLSKLYRCARRWHCSISSYFVVPRNDSNEECPREGKHTFPILHSLESAKICICESPFFCCRQTRQVTLSSTQVPLPFSLPPSLPLSHSLTQTAKKEPIFCNKGSLWRNTVTCRRAAPPDIKPTSKRAWMGYRAYLRYTICEAVGLKRGSSKFGRRLLSRGPRPPQMSLFKHWHLASFVTDIKVFYNCAEKITPAEQQRRRRGRIRFTQLANCSLSADSRVAV